MLIHAVPDIVVLELVDVHAEPTIVVHIHVRHEEM